MKKYIIYLLILLFFSCSNKLEVKEIRDGLFVDKNGNLLFVTNDNTILNNSQKKIITKVYLKGEEPIISLNEVIDSTTFKKIDNNYYVDRNHLYYFNETLDGGTLSTLSAKDSTDYLKHFKYKDK